MPSLFGRIRKPAFESNWPESWIHSYRRDLDSIYPCGRQRGDRVSYRNRFAHAIDLLLDATDPGGRLLDVGAAQGNFTIVAAELGYAVVWNDLRTDLSGYVRLKTARTDIEFLPGNLFDLPENLNGTFDAVLATEIIEHVAHPDAFLRRLSDLLAPRGVIVLTTPNGEYFRNTLPRFSACDDPAKYEGMQFQPHADGHIFLLHPDEWGPLAASAGLTVRSLQFFNNPLTSGYLGTRQLLPHIPLGLVGALEGLTEHLPRALAERLNTHAAVVLSRSPSS